MARRISTQGILRGLVLAVAVAALGAGTYYVYLVNFPPKKQGRVEMTAEEAAKVESYEARLVREATEAEARAKLLQLNNRYTTVSFVKPMHDLIFHEKNFKEAETILTDYRNAASTPMDRYRYGQAVNSIVQTHRIMDHQSIESTLKAWVESAPHSHFPLLIRAKTRREEALSLWARLHATERPPTPPAEVAELNQNAWDDLTAARALVADDFEVRAELTDMAVDLDKSPDVIRQFYVDTLALNPHHIGVRNTMLYFSLARRDGGREMAFELLASSERAYSEFPYLFYFVRLFNDRLAIMNPTTEDAMRLGEEAMKQQLALTPDEMLVLADAAYFASESGSLVSAANYFEQLGDRYPMVYSFDNIDHYHTARMNAFLAVLDEPSIEGTPREKKLLDLVLAAEPTHGGLSRFYLDYLLRTRDIEQTRAYFAQVKDPYILTGTLGEPPDFNYIEGLALANNIFWTTGLQGTDEERAVLDRAMELAPDNAFVHLIYAEHYSVQEKYRKARTYLERAREIDPAYLPALHSMAWLTYHQKRWDEGVALAKEFLASGDSHYVTVNIKDANEIIELCEKKKAREASETWGAWLTRNLALK